MDEVNGVIPLSSVKELNSITDLGRDNIIVQIQNHLKPIALTYIDNFSFNVRDIAAKDIMETFNNNIGKCLCYMGGSHKFVVLTETGILVVAILVRSPNKTIHVEIEDASIANADALREKINRIFLAFKKDSDSVFANVQWWSTGKHGVDFEEILEEINDTVHAEAYPTIKDFDKFISDYLNSDAQVLVLLGEPGTGKTRLIRHIIKCMGSTLTKSSTEKTDFSYSTVKDDNQIEVMYTIDSNVITADRFFISFLTGEASCMVLEDIDIDLSARKDGNTTMHKLLAGSDGFLRNSNKKLIISTNLKDESEMDDALLRRGRCYGVIKTRLLTLDEAETFLDKVTDKNIDLPVNKDGYSLAGLYQIMNGKNGDATKVRKMGF